MEQKTEAVYVVMSATLGKMGIAIRWATRARFNHVSIACREDLRDMVSFARRYYRTPFCGGFVEESVERYRKKGRYARIVVFRVPVEPSCKEKIQQQLKAMSENSEEYIYHMLAALQTPFHWTTRARNAHTCLSFAQMILGQTGVLPPKTLYRIEEMAKCLERFWVYDGTIEIFNLPSDPKYLRKMPRLRCWRMTVAQNMKLAIRILHRNDREESEKNG